MTKTTFTKKYRSGVQRSGMLMAAMLAATVPGTSMAALLNVNPVLPLLAFNNDGITTYSASTDLFAVDAAPLAMQLTAGGSPVFIGGTKDLLINIEVDASGALVGGVPGDDLSVSGDITLPGESAFSGVLLTGEVSGFGYQDTGGPSDNYDFTFTVTGGYLNTLALYSGEVAITMISESSDFIGDFTVDFGGEAKGQVGVVPLPAAAWLFGSALLGLGVIKRKRG